MYNIVFYEDSKGNCDLRDFLHMMQQKKKRAFYKLVAFLDHLAERGAAGDKAVCSSPGYTVYMHCIPEVCVILYAECRKDSSGEKIYVLLHHYFTNRFSGGVPLFQLYKAIRNLLKYRQMR